MVDPMSEVVQEKRARLGFCGLGGGLIGDVGGYLRCKEASFRQPIKEGRIWASFGGDKVAAARDDGGTRQRAYPASLLLVPARHELRKVGPVLALTMARWQQLGMIATRGTGERKLGPVGIREGRRRRGGLGQLRLGIGLVEVKGMGLGQLKTKGEEDWVGLDHLTCITFSNSSHSLHHGDMLSFDSEFFHQLCDTQDYYSLSTLSDPLVGADGMGSKLRRRFGLDWRDGVWIWPSPAWRKNTEGMI
ncbi:hypothetical protein Drorol1_Dr00018257 [Drosera rotundifolia]